MLRAALILLLTWLSGCDRQAIEQSRLATRCINASPDNRVKLSGSWASSFDVSILGDRVTVRTAVPVGISITGKLKFKHRTFHCRRAGDRIEFVRADWQ